MLVSNIHYLKINQQTISTKNRNILKKTSPPIHSPVKLHPNLMTDFQDLYNLKCAQFEELSQQLNQMTEQSRLYIEEIEKENGQLKAMLNAVQHQLDTLKEKKKDQTSILEKDLETKIRQRNDFKIRFEEFQKKVIELQNINQTLQSENRAANCMLSEYQQRVEKTMEELALLQIQLEQHKQSNQEQVARLKSQLKQTQEELYVIHLKHQKHNDQSEHRRSRLSSASFSSQQDLVKTIHPSQFLDGQPSIIKNQDSNIKNYINMDFKRNKQSSSFQKTISLVSGLINQLQLKSKKVKARKKVLAA